MTEIYTPKVQTQQVLFNCLKSVQACGQLAEVGSKNWLHSTRWHYRYRAGNKIQKTQVHLWITLRSGKKTLTAFAASKRQQNSSDSMMKNIYKLIRYLKNKYVQICEIIRCQTESCCTTCTQEQRKQDGTRRAQTRRHRCVVEHARYTLHYGVQVPIWTQRTHAI